MTPGDHSGQVVRQEERDRRHRIVGLEPRDDGIQPLQRGGSVSRRLNPGLAHHIPRS
jgi:hypothetical protein